MWILYYKNRRLLIKLFMLQPCRDQISTVGFAVTILLCLISQMTNSNEKNTPIYFAIKEPSTTTTGRKICSVRKYT